MDTKEADKFKRGNIDERKEVINKILEGQLKILKTSPDVNVLRRAQGVAWLAEELISALD